MADIFISYTSQDRDWAFWIGQELGKLGHAPRIHEWEIPGGGDIAAWMEERHDKADHVLLVISEHYLSKPYSSWERRSAQWAAQTDRPGFALPVRIEDCRLPNLLATVKRCDLCGVDEDEARNRLTAFLAPVGKPAVAARFPGSTMPRINLGSEPASFPGERRVAISNIPIKIPRHFVGRDDDFGAIDKALETKGGRVALTALHGLRGVGKTTLAAAYAEQRRSDYRAVWWIRAETEPTMRADLVGLGVQLRWVAPDAPEQQAMADVLERLRAEGQEILLVYDNAIDVRSLVGFLPRSGGARIIVTSTAPNWGSLAAPIEIEVWPKEVGADFLMVRTGRAEERNAALVLSEALGGLPLAHEQAAAYCERVGISLDRYNERFRATPSSFLVNAQDASPEYHDGLTVVKTFALAIDEAAMLHPAAKPLMIYAALLAPEPIPLFVFAEGRENFGEPLSSALAGDGLDEAVGALRSFALVDRESIQDERDPSILTDCIRLHRLVREVAARQVTNDTKAEIRCQLIAATSHVYPGADLRDPASWPRARSLNAIAMALVSDSDDVPNKSEVEIAALLLNLGIYKYGALAAYADARKLAERALAAHEKALGLDHPDTAGSLNILGLLLQAQGDLAVARSYYERALAVHEKRLGPDHSDTATILNNLGGLLQSQGDLAGARPYYERALAVCEKTLGPDHPDTAGSLNSLGVLLQSQGDPTGARPYLERALAVDEKTLGPDHPETAGILGNLGATLLSQGDPAGARRYYERALAVCEKTLGPDHPDTAGSLNNLGALLQSQGDPAGARPYFERALAVCEKALGPDHADTATSVNNMGYLLRVQGDLAGARSYYERALAIRERALGPAHPDTATSLNNLSALLQSQGDLAGARPYCERALEIYEKALGRCHPDTKIAADNMALLLDELRQAEDATAFRRTFGFNWRTWFGWLR